jgi:TonB family protein
MYAQRLAREMEDVSLLSVATFVLWLSCLAVGIAGLWLRYPEPQLEIKQPPPVVAEVMHVELTDESAPAPPDIGAPQTPPEESGAQPPPMPSAPAAPAAPPMIVVAAPSPTIAFAQPVETNTPTQIVEPKQAVPVHAPATAATQTTAQYASNAPPTPQCIIYGQGEGRQPAPDYPLEAKLAHQQGSVVVRFTVGEDGRVQNAQALKPSPFPLLNQAAVRTVHESWRFRAGPPRTYDVEIEFQLRQH